MVNSPVMRPYFLTGWHWGGPLPFPWKFLADDLVTSVLTCFRKALSASWQEMQTRKPDFWRLANHFTMEERNLVVLFAPEHRENHTLDTCRNIFFCWIFHFSWKRIFCSCLQFCQSLWGILPNGGRHPFEKTTAAHFGILGLRKCHGYFGCSLT